MIILMEKIAPPPPPVLRSDDEQLKLRMKAIATEDRWIKIFISRLVGFVRG